MAAEAPPRPPAAPPEDRRNHVLRIFIPWLILSVIADLIIWFVWKPHLPPGTMSSSAEDQQFTIAVMAVMAAPVMIFVLIYFGYALLVWRQKPDDDTDGPAIHGNTRIQATWITVTSAIVLGLFVFGTVELVATNGAGAGQGASPIWKPGGTPLQVQVIGQQWKFTYRWPSYGGVETATLELPSNRMIEFHVTSLDVIHSFWAYQLGVKADANPGFDNVAYVTTKGPLTFDIHCAELCGVWHGYMFEKGRVVRPNQFSAWITQQRAQNVPATKSLPPYSKQYFPDPQRRGG